MTAVGMLVLFGGCRDDGPCVDVNDVTACFGAGAPALRTRVVPRGSAPRAGWRCEGAPGSRRCEDRARGASRWECQGDRCEQRNARLPDDGQWECVDMDGAVICRGWSPAAAVVPGRPDPGWRCGARASVPLDRICVDFAPDLPEGAARGWRCFYEHSGGEHRICIRESQTPRLGARCGAGQDACGPHRACVAGRCLPEAPAPACWLDGDCGPGRRCKDGSCRAS